MPGNKTGNLEDDIRTKMNRLKHMTVSIVLTDFYFYLIGNYQKFLAYVDKGKAYGGDEMCYLHATMNGFNIIEYKDSIRTYCASAAKTIIAMREAGRGQIIRRHPELEKISQKTRRIHPWDDTMARCFYVSRQKASQDFQSPSGYDGYI